MYYINFSAPESDTRKAWKALTRRMSSQGQNSLFMRRLVVEIQRFN